MRAVGMTQKIPDPIIYRCQKASTKASRNPSYTLFHPCTVTANVETLILLRGSRSIEKRLFVFCHFKQGSTVELLLTV